MGANSSDILLPFNISVFSVLSTTRNSLCYLYGLSDGDIPLNTQCPNSTSSGATASLTGQTLSNNNNRRSIETGRGIKRLDRIPTYEVDPNCKKAPEPLDFCDRLRIRHPPFLAQEYISMMKLSLVSTRSYEVFIRHEVDRKDSYFNSLEFNSKAGYVSEAALTNWQKHNHLSLFNLPACDVFTWVTDLAAKYIF